MTLGADTAAGYRSERIRDLIEGRDDLTVADMSRIQNDTYNANAARLVPALLEDRARQQATTARARRRSRTGTIMQDADSSAAAYFNAVWRNLLARTFHDELPDGQWPEGGERWFSVVDSILDRPGNHWWDDITTRQCARPATRCWPRRCAMPATS